MKITIIPDAVKDGFRNLSQPLVRLIVRLKIKPNHITTISLILCIISALFFMKGFLHTAAVFLIIGGLCDMFDGAVARASNSVTKFGALYDSTLDRYAEFVVFIGIAFYFFGRSLGGWGFGMFASMMTLFAIAGSIMVSYVRARSEGLGFDCKVGILQRPERIVLVAVGALLSEFMLIIAMVVIAILANVTAIQRIYHIWSIETGAKLEISPGKVEEKDLASSGTKIN